MKRFILLTLILLFSITTVIADNYPSIPYKNIKNKTKIFYDAEHNIWTSKHDKKSQDYFTKAILNKEETYYLKQDGNIAFSTDCDFDFITNGKFIGYSNSDLKFYDLLYKDGQLSKTPLDKDEIQSLFKNYKIILLSEFSNNTNSLKIRKGIGNANLILTNDSDKTFNDFSFTSGNAKFKVYDLKGFITVSKKGMIQFSKFGADPKTAVWYILLVR